METRTERTELAEPQARGAGFAGRRPLLLTMCVGYFLVLLDVTALNIALPPLRVHLHAGPAILPWVVSGYAVPFAALLLVGGDAGDRFGHRRIVVAGLVTFGAASLWCALAPNIGMLVAARALQGSGAALLLPGTLAVLTRTFTGAERTRAIGVWAAVGGAALPAGPLVGGVLVQVVGWRAVFWLNLPVVAAAIVAVRALVPDDRRGAAAGGARPVRARRLDLPGAVTGTAFLALAATAAAARSVLVGLLAALALVAFVVLERRSAEPLLPLGLFRRRAFSVANGAAFAMNAGAQGMLFVVALLLQGVQGRSPAEAGFALVPSFAMLVLVPPLAARAIAARGVRPVLVTGLVLVAAGIGLLLPCGAHSPYVTLLPALCLWGMGLGCITPSVVTGAVSAVPPERAGLASAVNNAARQAGNALGVPACAAITGPVGAAYVTGMHRAAVVVTVLFAVTAVAALAYPGRPVRP